MLRSVGNMCFELVCLLCTINSAVSLCVRGLFIVVIGECGNRCVRGDGPLFECFTNVCTYTVQTPIV